MDEIEQLKARLIATNQFVMELIEREIGSRIAATQQQRVIEILQQQLLEKNTPADVEALATPPVEPPPPE